MSGVLRISDAAALAIHATALIAGKSSAGGMTVTALAGLLRGSEAHLHKVMQRLVRHGIVQSRRGPKGGFELGRAAAQITILEIYEAVDGPLKTHGCLLGRPVCPPGAHCVLGNLTQSVARQMRHYMSSSTLADIMLSPELLAAAGGDRELARGGE